MKTNKNHIQQGDVNFLKISKLPGNLKPVKQDARGAVVAEGETTGHYHGCDEGGVAILEAPTGERYVINETNEPRTFKHQEHEPVTIEPNGVYRIGIVREYDYWSLMQRRVID